MNYLARLPFRISALLAPASIGIPGQCSMGWNGPLNVFLFFIFEALKNDAQFAAAAIIRVSIVRPVLWCILRFSLLPQTRKIKASFLTTAQAFAAMKAFSFIMIHFYMIAGKEQVQCQVVSV
jgi:hypothetical protein